jgi:hypothetical protein
MHAVLRLVILVTAILVAAFGCASPKAAKQRGGAATQGFVIDGDFGMPAPVDVPQPAMNQTLAQPENPEGESKQTMTEERTEVRPDGTVIRTIRNAATELGGSQSVADILKAYASGEYAKRILLALLLGGVAWFIRTEWQVASGVLAAGAVATAFFGPIAALCAAVFAGGVWVAYHVMKSRIPFPLP